MDCLVFTPEISEILEKLLFEEDILEDLDVEIAKMINRDFWELI